MEEVDYRKLYEELRAVVVQMHLAEDAYGCGFYSDEAWGKAYDLTRKIVGLPEEEFHE